MLRKIGIIFALVSAIATTQLPLGFVQFCAWAGMLSEYAEQTGSIQTSWEWTFDGQHRCDGCDFVSDQVAGSEDEEQAPPSGASFAKLLLSPLSKESVVVKPSTVIGLISDNALVLSGVLAGPVTPPPRPT